jgi:hypothetical protein
VAQIQRRPKSQSGTNPKETQVTKCHKAQRGTRIKGLKAQRAQGSKDTRVKGQKVQTSQGPNVTRPKGHND